MDKINNYILKNNGIGALVLLTLSAVYGLYYSITSSDMIETSIPYIQEIIEEVTPIKVVNGVVVTPADTYKDIKLIKGLKGAPSIIIDTTRDSLDTTNLPEGIYLTRKNFYTVSANEVRSKALAGNFELPREDYTKVMYASVKWIALGIMVGFTIVLFFTYLLLMLFYTLVLKIAERINKKTLSFDESMRLNAVLFAGLSIAFFFIELIGIYLGNLIFFIVMVGLQIYAVKQLPEK